MDFRPVEDSGASHEATAESTEEQAHAILQFASARQLVHKDRDAGGRGVAVLVEVDGELLFLLTQVFSDRVDDAEVSLVEKVEVDVVAGEAILFEDDVDILDAGADGEFEDLAAGHDERLGAFLDAIVGSRFERPFIVKDVGVGVGGDTEIAEAVALGDDDSAGAVGKEDRGLAFVPVAETRGFLGGDDEDIFSTTCFDESVSDVEGIDEACAGAVEVGAGAAAAERAKDDAAQRGCDIAIGDVRTYKIIDFFGVDARGVEGSLSRGDSQFAESFLAEETTGLDAGAGGNPAVAGFEEASKHVVSHNFLRERATCSNNFHTIKLFVKTVGVEGRKRMMKKTFDNVRI